MKNLTLVAVLLFGVCGQVLALDFPMEEKWRTDFGSPTTVLAEYWLEEGSPQFLVTNERVVSIRTRAGVKCISDSLPGNIICINRVQFPEPYGMRILVGHDAGIEPFPYDGVEISQLRSDRLDSLKSLNLMTYFGNYASNGSTKQTSPKRFFRPDTIADPTSFFTLSETVHSNSRAPYSDGDNTGAFHRMKLAGYISPSDPHQREIKIPKISILMKDQNGKDLLLIGGKSYAYSSGYSGSDFSGSTSTLTKFYHSIDSSLSYVLTSAMGIGKRHCTLTSFNVARSAKGEFMYPIYFDRNEVQRIKEIRLNDFSLGDSLILPLPRDRWDLIPIKDPKNADLHTHLLAISNEGDVVPLDLDKFAFGDIFNLGYPITTAFSWDSDQDGKEEIHIQSGKNLICYEMPVVGVTDREFYLPSKLSLVDLFPNPFNSTTTIFFQTSAPAEVTVAVYDLSGREVATLVEGYREAGSHTVNWSAGNIANGLYIVRLEGNGVNVSQKIVLMK